MNLHELLWWDYRNRDHMFSRPAAVCGVTIDEYERIAFHYGSETPQTQLDIANIDFDFIARNYET